MLVPAMLMQPRRPCFLPSRRIMIVQPTVAMVNQTAHDLRQLQRSVEYTDNIASLTGEGWNQASMGRELLRFTTPDLAVKMLGDLNADDILILDEFDEELPDYVVLKAL